MWQIEGNDAHMSGEIGMVCNNAIWEGVLEELRDNIRLTRIYFAGKKAGASEVMWQEVRK